MNGRSHLGEPAPIGRNVNLRGRVEPSLDLISPAYEADVVCVTSTDVQWAHRRACTGISLRHSGHCFVAGAAGASGFFLIEASLFTGTTTNT